MCHLELIKWFECTLNWRAKGSECLGGLIVKPSDPFSVLPLSPSRLASLSEKCAISLLSPILPMPDIFPPIRPIERAETLLLILYVFSIVAATVRPGEVSPAIHLIIPPCPRVLSPIRPAVPALPFDVI